VLNIAMAVKEGVALYKKKFGELVKYIGPLLLLQIVIDENAWGYLDKLTPTWYFSSVVFIMDITIDAAMILLAISIFLSEKPMAVTDFQWSAKRLFTIWFSTLYIGVSISLGLLFFIIPGLIILGVSLFYSIYIIKYDQGPIEAVASSVDVVKTSIIRVTVMIIALSATWVALAWLVVKVSSIGLISPSLYDVLSGAVLGLLYMYLHSITVTAWKQLCDAT